MNSKSVNWSILAPGKIAQKFADGLKHVDGAKLRAVGSRNLERASGFANQYGFEKAFGSYEELAGDSETDVIYIASPHTYHYKHTLLCLEHGKHVLCEKPFSMSKQQSEHMVELAGKKNLFLMEALWTRFLPSYLTCKKMAEEKKIGNVKVILANFGFRAPFDEESRMYNLKLGGGSLLDIGIYPIFLAYSFFGKPDHIRSQVQKSPTGSDISCAIQFNYTVGQMASLFSTFDVTTSNTAEIIGDKGTLKLNRMWHIPTSITHIDEQGKETLIEVPSVGNGYNYIAREVTRCIQNGLTESSEWSLKDALTLTEIMDEILLSHHIIYPEV